MRLRVAVAGIVGCAAVASPTAALARPAVHTLLRTPTAITTIALDRSGRGVWAQYGRSGIGCFRLHTGTLLRAENRVLTRCHPTAVGFKDNPIALAASARASRSRLRIAWAEGEEGYHEQDETVWAYVGGSRGRVKVAYLYLDCGADACGAAGFVGRELGPMASKDGTMLYAVDDISGATPCNPDVERCTPAVTGGRIRQIHYSPRGAYATTVPGAPAANALVTAGGRLAEQVYGPNGEPAPVIQIRDVNTGTLRATITVTGTLHAMAMSHRVLALLTTDTTGNHLVRYRATSGAPLGSTHLGRRVNRDTLAICGKRILYHTNRGITIFRIDLNRSHTVGVLRSSGGMLDRNGIRWVTTNRSADGEPSTVRGIEFR